MSKTNLDILIVDDNPADARLVGEMLKDCGCGLVRRLDFANGLVSALKILRAAAFDAILLDIKLPDSRGLAGLQIILNRYPRTPVILFTGLDEEGLAEKALKLGAGDYLIKDHINPGLLCRSIRYAIERKQAELLLKRDNDVLEKMVSERTGELLSTRDELEKARRLSDIGVLAATVAHELRNPLAAIAMAAYNIRRKAADPLLDKHFRNIDKKINESNHIINNLLFYSRLKPPRYEIIGLRPFLEECVRDARGLGAGKKAAAIRLHAPGEPTLEADPVQIREVVSNLLSNAYDALAGVRAGTITLSASVNESSVSIRVRDTGAGIPESLLPRIFEPFFTTKAKGTGLGLCVCKQLVELHGGDISVASGFGKGTEVSVTLPKKRKNEK